jgi:hypothetical protein
MLPDVADRGEETGSFDRLRSNGLAEHAADGGNHKRERYGAKEREDECQLHGSAGSLRRMQRCTSRAQDW